MRGIPKLNVGIFLTLRTCKFNLIFVLYFSDFNHKVLSSTTRCLAKGKYPKGKACILNLSINKYTTSTVGRLHIAYHKL